MSTPTLRCVEVKAFVPARDFALAASFYEALGFTRAWSGEGLAHFHHGDCSFLLQDVHVPEHAQNFQMHLLVEDVGAWWQHVQSCEIASRFGTRLEPPRDQPWAMRDFVLVDPSGVLWRIAQNLPRQAAANVAPPASDEAATGVRSQS